LNKKTRKKKNQKKKKKKKYSIQFLKKKKKKKKKNKKKKKKKKICDADFEKKKKQKKNKTKRRFLRTDCFPPGNKIGNAAWSVPLGTVFCARVVWLFFLLFVGILFFSFSFSFFPPDH
jgi:hypothetical protein